MAVNTQDLGGELRSQGYKIGTYSYPDGLGVYPDLQHRLAYGLPRPSSHKPQLPAAVGGAGDQ